MIHLGQRERRVLGCDGNVAGRGKCASETQRASLDQAKRGEAAGSQRLVGFEYRLAAAHALQHILALQLARLTTHAEVGAGGPEHDEPRVVLRHADEPD